MFVQSKLQRAILLFAIVFLLLVITVFTTFGSANNTPVSDGLTPQAITDQYIVVMKQDAAQAAGVDVGAEIAKRNNITPQRTYTGTLSAFVATLTPAELANLQNDPAVDYIEQDYIIHFDTTQTNPPWGLDRTDQPWLPLNNTYTYSKDGTGVTAYVIDTGIRSTHLEFGGRVITGTTFVNDNNGTEDCNGHGTHVAGTIGGATYGVAKNVTLVPVRVFPCVGGASYSTIIAAVDWVTLNAQLPAVVNMSLGGPTSTALNTAVNNSINTGISYVVSAGNGYGADSCLQSPAGTAAALTVGSSTSADSVSSFSNLGTCVDMFAPGSNILSAYHTNDTASAPLSGTSMAAPHVAGVAALYLQAFPNASPAAVHNELVGVATPNQLSGIGNSPNLLLWSPFTTYNPPAPTPPTSTPTPPVTSTHPTTEHAYMSFKRNGSVNGVTYRDEDVVGFNINTGQWEMVFDGSDVGVTIDLTGFNFDDNGDLLMTFQKEVTLPGLGLVDDSDIVRFEPTQLGPNTQGVFHMYLDGSDVGLDTNGEDIDSVGLTYDGRIFVSTLGTVRVNDANNQQFVARDEDLILFNPISLGDNTQGHWQLWVDGSTFGLDTNGDEDVWAATIDRGGLYISTRGAFDVAGVSNSTATGSSNDIIGCWPDGTIESFTCNVFLAWDGDANGIQANDSIDGLSIPR